MIRMQYSLNILVAPDSRMIDPLLESSLVVGVALCAASESHLLAKIVSSLTADATLPAGNPDFEGYPVAYLKASDLGANGNNLSGGLVPEGQRMTSTEVSVCEFLVIGDV